MREIKFQAWDLDAEQMYNWESIKQLFHEHLAHPRVKIRQYTGLKDKNGREIYEGDIVIDERKNSAEVVFDDGCFCVIGYLGDLRTHPIRDSLFCGERFEVIGNIYENPELLEASHASK
ncbi:YopX family protein [Bacillus subtilis]